MTQSLIAAAVEEKRKNIRNEWELETVSKAVTLVLQKRKRFLSFFKNSADPMSVSCRPLAFDKRQCICCQAQMTERFGKHKDLYEAVVIKYRANIFYSLGRINV